MEKFLKWLLPPKHSEPVATPPQLTEADVEAMIERAGRKLVFQRAQQLGWSSINPPPIWVWPQICYEVQKMQAKQSQPEGTVH